VGDVTVSVVSNIEIELVLLELTLKWERMQKRDRKR
jgi:hypothetical protein